MLLHLLCQRSADAAVADNDRCFKDLIRSIERRRFEVKQLIRDQEKAEVSRAEGLLKRLEQEIAELKRRDAELGQLSHTEDHIHFLQVTLVFHSSTTLCKSYYRKTEGGVGWLAEKFLLSNPK